MSRVNFQGIESAKEAQLLTDDLHNLVIVKAEHAEGKVPGRYRTQVILDAPEEPDTQSVFHYLGAPATLETYLESHPDKNEEDYQKAESFKALNIKRFLHHFDIPYDEEGYDTDEFPGKTAATRTKRDEPDEKGFINVSLMLPQLEL